MSHNLMLPKEITGQGIPEKSSDWTCIENSVRGMTLAGGAADLPPAPAAIPVVVEERCVGTQLAPLDGAWEVGSEPATAMSSEMIKAKFRVLNVSFLLRLFN